MESELKDGKFYILDVKDADTSTKYLFDNDKTAIAKVKTKLKTITAENLTLMLIDTNEEKWQISQVPWTTIVTEMMKE